jgi:adenine/guanine phosphoribosyltransferase-like PRPP-binding protein
VDNSLKRKVRKLTWAEYGQYIDRLLVLLEEIQKERLCSEMEWTEVVGVPRGGLPIAVAASHRLEIPLLADCYPIETVGMWRENLLFVDDIVDSGETRAKILASVRGEHAWGSMFVRPETSPFV